MRNVDLFDDYLVGALSAQDKAAFEKRLKDDAEFAHEFNTHKLFVESIIYTAGKSEMKKKLDAIHEEEFGKENVISIEFFSRRKAFFRVAAVAASVSLIVCTTAWFSFSSTKNENRAYVEAVNKISEEMKGRLQEFYNRKMHRDIVPASKTSTGFLISSKGYFLTSYHSVKNSDSVMVLSDALGYVSANLVWNDEKLDVAIFKLDNTENLKIKDLPIAFRTNKLDLGEKIFALGYPREDVVYSEGNVSAASGILGDTTKYQLSMLINMGNSGSPVLDEQGNLVGLIAGYSEKSQGVSFAVKAENIYDMIKDIPDAKLRSDIQLNGKNTLKKLKRTEQIKKLKPYVFNIMVYRSGGQD